MDFWDKVRYMRIRNKITQQEVADGLGWAQANYARAEKTKPNVSQEDISKIAKAIHVTEVELIGLDEILTNAYSADVKQWLCKASTQRIIMELYQKQA